MLIKTKFSYSMEEMSPEIMDIVKGISEKPLDEMLKIMKTQYPKEWDGIRSNLSLYIPVLNRIDSILEEHIIKYKLDQEVTSTQEVSSEDVNLVQTCLDYSYQLLEYSTSRAVYNSAHRVYDLIVSNSLDIRISALKLTCLLSERFLGVSLVKFSIPKKHKDILLKMCRSFPPQSVPTYFGPTRIEIKTQSSQKEQQSKSKKYKKSKNNGKDKNQDLIHISLLNCMKSNTQIPAHWKSLNFEYYNTISVEDQTNNSHKRRKKSLKNNVEAEKSQKLDHNSGEGLRFFKLGEEAVKKLSYQQIYDKAVGVIPKEKWFDFILQVYVSKAYSSGSFDSIKLREKLVTMKCLAVAAASSCCFYSVIASSVFDEEPYLLSYMSDLINPDNKVPYEPSLATLRAFVNISGKKSSGSDLIRALGGNISHGLLFHILKSILKSTKEGTFKVDQSFLNYFYNLIANLIENKNLITHLRTAGLLNIFMEFLTLRNNYRMTRSGPLHLIEMFIDKLPEALDDFIANDGFRILIDLLEYEVDFAINNPDYEGGAPKHGLLSHQITARQVKVLNFLLKLVFDLITNHTGDRMRNLYDSPLLKSLNKILLNTKIFGFELLVGSVRIIIGIINSEPTAYSILNEAGVIEVFFKQFDSLLLDSADLILELPEAISAISLNINGLARVKESGIINNYFEIFLKPEICKELVRDDNVMALGQSIDELARHHPELKPIIDEEILGLIDTVPKHVFCNSVDFYQSPSGSLYKNRNESNIHKEDDCKELETWSNCKEGRMIQCTVIFLSSMFENSKQWKRLYSNINVSNLMNFITVKNAPFDYALSSPMFHIGNIIKCIDQGTSCHCLASLNQEIILVLKRLHDFIYYNSDNISYFSQFDKNSADPTSKARSVISDLGCMNSLLYILSDVYGKIPKTQGSKTSYFAEEFGSEDGLKLIHELCMYYRRLSLEEVILHSQTPADVAKNAFTLVQKISHKQGEIGEPNVDDGAWDGTSAKFKNISLLYFHFTRSKFWLRSIFNSLCRINAEKRSDSTRLFGLTPKYAVAIVKEYSDTVISLLSNINTTNSEIESGYVFCILNQLYLTINYKLRSASPVNSMVCICLLQNYSFNKLRELALKYFTALKSFPTEEIKKFAELKHTTIDRCSTTIAVLDQVLGLYAELGSINNVGALANPTKLYAYLGDDAAIYGKEVLSSIQIQTAIASFGLLQDLLHSDGLCVLDKIPDKIPVQLIEQLVLISKSAYTNFKSQSLTFQGKLYPISPETTCPSDRKIEYLCGLGVSSKKIAMELLLLYGDSLDQFLEETGDDLCLHFQDVEPADWDAILDKAHKTKFVPQKIEPVEPQYSQTYILHNLDDLNFHRGANELNFIDYWIKMAQLYPQADSNISDLLLSVFGNSSYGEHMDNVLTPVFRDIFASSFDLDDRINTRKLSSMLQLLAYLMSNLSFTKYHEMVDNIVNFLIKQIIPENVSALWFCNALQVFEKVLSVTKIPMAPIAGQITVENKLSQLVASYPNVYSLDANIEETLLGCLLSIERIDKEETALQIAKVLLLLTDCDQRINNLAKSNMIRALTTCVRNNTESTSKLQNYVINIFRRCMESQKVLEAYIYKDVNRLMDGKKTTNKKPKIRELKSVIQENAPSVLRSGKVFINAVTDSCILYQCTTPLKNLNIAKITDEQKQFLGDEDIAMKEVNTCDDTSYSTGLMHYLLSELMTVSKKDLTVSAKPDNDSKEEKNDDEFKPRNIYARELILRNKDLPYAVFLLQAITELLFSYKQAKTEFLTFSKKSHDPYSLDKPRSTALNMLVHRFITVNPFDKSTAPENKVHRLLSLLSSFCIFALVSTVPIKGLDYNTPKIVDPDITFARKFTVDILIKVIKEAEESKHTSIVKYGKIVDILDLVCKILGENFELDLLSGLDRVLTKYDAFYFVKELSDKKFANIITGVLARLDINFPYTEDISSGVLRCLSLLGQIKVDFQNLFKEGQQAGDAEEEVLSDEDLDEGEETPDLLRNSTLGMYDVDDIEDEDDEDDMENDFLDDQDIEIVYSDGVVDIDSDSDMDVGSGHDELEGRSVDDDEIDIIFDEDDEDDGDDDNEGDGSHEQDRDDGEFDEDHHSDYGDISDDVNSVDELLGDNNFMIDIVSGSESDSEEDDLSDENIEFVSGDEFDNFDDDDDDEADLEAEMDDNSDDDSAILQEWIEEHEANSQRRRRDRRGSAPPLILNEFDSNDEDEDPFGYRLFPISSSGMGIPQPSENSFGARQGNQMSLLEFAQDMLSPHRNNGLERSPVNFGGALMELRRSLEGGFIMGRRFQQPNSISLKSTLQRWNEISELFAGSATSTASRVIPSIVNSIYDRSLRISEEDSRTAKALLENKRKAKEAEELKRRQQQQEEARQREEQQSNAQPIEPIYVDIGGRTVDISGTGIDPEFLLALPEDMREEVYEQHNRERRAQEFISSNNTELDSDFMSALPSDVRIQLLREMEYVHEDNDEGDFDDDPTFEFEVDRANIETPEISHGERQFAPSSAPFISISNEEVEAKPNDKKASPKTFFPPMVDRSGIAALLKLVFLPQLYFKRESFFKTVAYLCYNKHTRSELVAILLYILQEGLKDMSSLEAIYAQLCQRANASLTNSEKNSDATKSLSTCQENNDPSDASFPTNCTPLTVATQAIDLLQYLLENENHMRFHFLTDQDGTPFMKKISKKHKLKDNGYRFPVNVLLNLLDNNMIKEDTNLMDILSRTIQISTRPLPTMKTKLDELEKASEISKKVPQLPTIPDKSLKQIINILVSDECASKVFQQTIASIQNLSVLDNARVVFPRELSRKAMHLSSKIAREVRELIKELCDIKSDTDEILSLKQFSSGSSDQAKLLRVLTALDYLFQIKEGDEQTAETEELKTLYRNSALGPLWGALSDCLKILSQNENMNYIAVILSPLIEALMVVCKHSKVQRMNVLDVLRYEEKELDFAKEPIESLFFTFTEEHKKILNHMIRNNPKLMSGPFSVLVRNPKVLEFDNKRVYFDQKLHKDEDEREKMEITIRRDQVFLDSYRALFFKPSEQIRKSNLEIHFRGEEGVDAGGLTREWYQVLSRQMFDPNYALFIPVASDKTTFHPNRTSWVNPEHLSFFKFVGMIIGKAVYDGYMLDCHFSRAVFKRILGKNVSLKDMESLDLDYYKSLVWMLENDITDIIVETFSVETDDYGEHKIIDLKPDGRNIAVTEENKQEYVKLIVEYRLLTSIKDQMDKFLEGFDSIIPKELISIFDEQELELLISGLPDIDVDDWKNHTTYENYSSSSPQIQWFWRAVKSFDVEERAKLLQFATGTSKVPLNGFKELAGMNGISKFSIHRVYSSTDRLPTAHTCFNQVDLPEYESYGKLRNALLLAIREGHEGFGFA